MYVLKNLPPTTAVSLTVCFSAEYGGAGLDFSYSVAINEQLGSVHCGAVPMAVAVQTDMSTPALARYAAAGASSGRCLLTELLTVGDLCRWRLVKLRHMSLLTERD